MTSNDDVDLQLKSFQLKNNSTFSSSRINFIVYFLFHQNMATQEYMNDVDCFRSYNSLRDMIYFNKRTPVKITTVAKKPSSGTKTKRVTMDLNEFRNDKNVIIAIQNDAKFINIIMNCRKQRSPIVYLFVENGYITCVIKNANGYPIIFVRLPIDNVYAYAATNVNNVYELPLSNLLNKDIKYVKNNSYLIVFRHNNQNVDFDYDMTQNEASRNKITINNIAVHNNNVINQMFDDRMGIDNPNYGLMPNGVDKCNNFLLELYNMNILMLKEVADVNNFIQFTQKQTNKTKNYIEISNDNMNFVNEVSNSRNEKLICSAQDAIIWSNALSESGKSVNTNIVHEDDDVNELMRMMQVDSSVGENKEAQNVQNKLVNNCRRFNIVSYESLFKMNYNKSISNNDKLYYVFGSYLGNFMFMKFVTTLDVNLSDKIGSDFGLTRVFQSGYQMIECYMCEEI